MKENKLKKEIADSGSEADPLSEPSPVSSVSADATGTVTNTPPVKGEIVGKIISSNHYIFHDTKIGDAAQFLAEHEDVYCFGVVDRNLECRGILLRKDLFDLLGQKYGRDLYLARHIELLMREVPVFQFNRNLYSVADEIQKYLSDRETIYFNVTDSLSGFCGIFSTKDMLVYLSEITRKELLLAAKIQSKITKEETSFETENFETVCGSSMARGVGGDFYFIKEYCPGKWVFAICDVSGTGVSASLVSTVLGGIFNSYDFTSGFPVFIRNLNSYLFETFESEKFVTAIISDFDSSTGRILLYDMGHSIAFLFRNGKLHRMDLSKTSTFPLGMENTLVPAAAQLVMKPSDTLLLMTDGIEEQVNNKGEVYGQQRVQRFFASKRYADISLQKKLLFKEINTFKGNLPQYDDMTVMMIRYKGMQYFPV